MKELKPCPKLGCKGKALVCENRRTDTNKTISYFVICTRCTIFGDFKCREAFPSKQEAIEAWNRRAERTCHNQNPTYTRNFICSECGVSSVKDLCEDPPNYCPNCGAKAVEG